MRIFPFALIASLFFSSCQLNQDQKPETPVTYSSLRYAPALDSVFLNANSGSLQLSLEGSVLNTSQKVIKNTGIITEVDYTVTTIDTVFQSVDVAKAQWSTSNSNVAIVSNGLVSAKNPGTAIISASAGGAQTKNLIVDVRAVNVAPGLWLDPPENILTFRDSISVSGATQNTAVLSLMEPRSGTILNSIPYSASDGRFSALVTGIQTGMSKISVTATHFSQSNLSTTQIKYVTYYSFGTTGADSIVGNWMGTTLGKDFPFSISNSIIITRYDITGKLDIQFEGIGLVRDIDLVAVVNSDGTISGSLSKTYQGFSISGSFGGKFKTTGTAEGSYSAKAEKSGWPKISFTADWTAVKIQ